MVEGSLNAAQTLTLLQLACPGCCRTLCVNCFAIFYFSLRSVTFSNMSQAGARHRLPSRLDGGDSWQQLQNENGVDACHRYICHRCSGNPPYSFHSSSCWCCYLLCMSLLTLPSVWPL